MVDGRPEPLPPTLILRVARRAIEAVEDGEIDATVGNVVRAARIEADEGLL